MRGLCFVWAQRREWAQRRRVYISHVEFNQVECVVPMRLEDSNRRAFANLAWNDSTNSQAKPHMSPLEDKWAEWSEVTGERQRADRYPLMRLVRFESSAPLVAEGQPSEEEGAGIALNVGNGGLCLLLDWAPEVREVFRLHVPMPVSWAKTPTLAQVRWVRSLPFGDETIHAVGLQFVL